MFRPHHDLKTGDEVDKRYTLVYSFKNRAPTKNPGAKEKGTLLVKGSIMVYCTLFV